ncbi:MAG: YfhO family protein [Chloroflexota bacterium]|nr:YfhO family protein [Chloroflexota bacterium]
MSKLDPVSCLGTCTRSPVPNQVRAGTGRQGPPAHVLQAQATDRQATDRKRDLYVVLILLMLWGLFFWRYLTPVEADRVAFPRGDLSEHFYILRSFAFDEFRAGRFPLWGRGVFDVYPFQADPESALFYPPVALELLTGLALGWDELPLQAVQLESMAHVLLASLLCYLFLREEVKHRPAALLGSVAFSYGGYLTSYPLQQITFLEAAVWLPLALWSAKLLTSTGKRRYAVLTGLAFTLAFLTGNPQNLTQLFYAALAYYVYQCWRARTPWPVALRRFAIVLALTVGLSAVQLLPSLEWWRNSTRASISFEKAAVAFPPKDLIQLLVTGLVSYWQPLYTGTFSLVLAFLACVTGRKRDLPFWAGLTIVSLIFSFGKNLFGFEVAYLTLPGYSLFRDQERHAYLMTFGLSVLAAYGLDTLLSPLKRWERKLVHHTGRYLRYGLPVVFILIGVAALLSRLELDVSDSQKLADHLAVLFLCLSFSTALLYLRSYRPRSRYALGILALMLVIFNLFTLNRGRYYAEPHDPYQVNSLFQQIEADPGWFRVQEDEFPIIRNVAGRRRLREVWGVAIRLRHYVEFLEEAPEDVRWKLLGVKYVITWRGSLVTWRGRKIAGAEMLGKEGEGESLKHLYRLPWQPRRTFVVRDVVSAKDRDELYESLRSPGFDPFRTAVLQEPLPLEPAPGAEDEVLITADTPAYIGLRARLGAPGLLVLSEVTYPGWRVYVNSRPARLHEADGVLRAVLLPKGKSKVVFRFLPLTFYAGAALSSLTVLLIAGYAIVRRI